MILCFKVIKHNIQTQKGRVYMEVAYTLYRVSTKKQVDKQKDDIPMQREACREFAQRMGWQIDKEFLEKGVSGFKVSAENRDAIQDLKNAALAGEFQILLCICLIVSAELMMKHRLWWSGSSSMESRCGACRKASSGLKVMWTS